MVTIQDTDLKEGIIQAISRAKSLASPILVSEVHKINPIEPFTFFVSGNQSFVGERFLWKDPSDETWIVGLGLSQLIQSDQDTDRFFHVEKKWKHFIENAMIYNQYSEVGIGPLMFGGFSFDPLKEKTSLWSKFSHSLFHVPKYMLSIVKGEFFLTTNVVCTQHDDEELFSLTMKERDSILAELNQQSHFSLSHLRKSQEVEPGSWKNTVADVVSDLKTGSMKKVVLARELRLFFEDTVLPESVLDRLLKEQPQSYVFAFESQGDCFIGASPERLVKKNGEKLFSACVAGSIGRGMTDEEDEQLGNELLTDQKNLIEHQYVVEMIKGAMSELCEKVTLPSSPQLLKMRDIQHLYTPITGSDKNNASLLLMVEKLHPTPALGGLPKQAAVEKIRQVELLDRGFYAAPLGWLDYRENGEFAVAIRSGLIQGNEVSLFAGCGVVSDSDPESEYMETKMKFRPMLTALGGY